MIKELSRHAPHDICRKQSGVFRLLSSIATSYISADYFAIIYVADYLYLTLAS